MEVLCDSQVVVKQTNAEYQTHSDNLKEYTKIAQVLVKRFPRILIRRVDILEFYMADRSAKIASGEVSVDNQMPIEVHYTPTLLSHIHIVDEVTRTWIDEIQQFIEHG